MESISIALFSLPMLALQAQTGHRGLTAVVTSQLMNPIFIIAGEPPGKAPKSEITSKIHTDVLLPGATPILEDDCDVNLNCG